MLDINTLIIVWTVIYLNPLTHAFRSNVNLNRTEKAVLIFCFLSCTNALFELINRVKSLGCIGSNVAYLLNMMSNSSLCRFCFSPINGIPQYHLKSSVVDAIRLFHVWAHSLSSMCAWINLNCSYRNIIANDEGAIICFQYLPLFNFVYNIMIRYWHHYSTRKYPVKSNLYDDKQSISGPDSPSFSKKMVAVWSLLFFGFCSAEQSCNHREWCN